MTFSSKPLLGRTVGFAAGFAILAGIAPPARSWYERPSPQGACAAFDLHLIALIDQAGEDPAARRDVLRAAADGMDRARKLCAEGKIEASVLTYEAHIYELAPNGMADERHFASLCGRELRC